MTPQGPSQQAPPPEKSCQGSLKDLLDLWRLSGENVPKFVELITREASQDD